MAPTTAGEFLRQFGIGAVSDLRRINRLAAERVRGWQTSTRVTIDLDASLYEQCSKNKQGSRMNYKGEVGYYPLFAFWAEELEMLQTHLQSGNAGAAPKAVWFLDQALQNAPEGRPVCLRADSEFYTWPLIEFCKGRKIIYAMTADQSPGLMAQIAALPETAWQRYAPGAQVTELQYAPTGHCAHRYVVKRQRVKDKKKGLIWRHHVVITNDCRRSARKLMQWALGRSTMENLIKEYKDDFGFEKMPTRNFQANWTWLLISQLAWNLLACSSVAACPSSVTR
ncbi:MAG: transposase [Acidobacteriota bacterium]|nr:transposase [Acidobacteriota bacterium]